MNIVAAILAALENPAVDAAIINAGAGLVSYFKSLPAASRQAAIDQLSAAATSEATALAAFDADILTTQAQLTALRAEHGDLKATVTALRAELAARAMPLATP